MVRGDLTCARPDTRTLALAAELSEVRGVRACIAYAQRSAPQMQAETRMLARGAMSYAGVDSPISEAVGVGTLEPAGDDEVEAILAFYRERGAPARVVCGPNTRRGFVVALVAYGFVVVERQRLLVADLDDVAAIRDERVAPRRSVEAWAHASAHAMSDGAPPNGLAEFSRLLAGLPQTTALEMREGETIVATACMDVDGAMAGFFAGATHPSHRGHGLQTALIRDRAARARAAGARFGRTAVAPGSVSERNFLRQGFVDAGERTLWQRR